MQSHRVIPCISLSATSTKYNTFGLNLHARDFSYRYKRGDIFLNYLYLVSSALRCYFSKSQHKMCFYFGSTMLCPTPLFLITKSSTCFQIDRYISRQRQLPIHHDHHPPRTPHHPSPKNMRSLECHFNSLYINPVALELCIYVSDICLCYTFHQSRARHMSGVGYLE